MACLENGAVEYIFVRELDLIVENDCLSWFKDVAKTKGSLNLRCSSGSALRLAVQCQSYKIFDFLMDAPNVNVNDIDDRRNSLLSWAIEEYCKREIHGWPSLLKYFAMRLIDNGADINLTNVDGETAFTMCCHYGNDECILRLLARGANRRASFLKTWYLPFDLAAQSRKCAPGTLMRLFYRTYYEIQWINQVHINTITALCRCRYTDLVGMIFERVTLMYIPSEHDLMHLVEHLDVVPYTIFTDMLKIFPSIERSLSELHILDLRRAFRQIQYGTSYRNYFAHNCFGPGYFNGTRLYPTPQIIIPTHMLTDLIKLVLRQNKLLGLDLDHLYDLYGFTPLFEMLLETDLKCVKEVDGPLFVAVWFNLMLDTDHDWFKQKKFIDYSSYFAREDQVPSLLQLSRDTTRKHFIKKYKLQKPCDYALLLKKLQICTAYKDILRFKRKIYQ